MAWSGAWKHLIESANWIRQALRVHDARLRCDACRNEFVPGPAGAATFIDEQRPLRLTVCSGCEWVLHARALRQQPEQLIASSSDPVGRALEISGNRSTGAGIVRSDPIRNR